MRRPCLARTFVRCADSAPARIEMVASDRSASTTSDTFAARSIDYYGATAGVELGDVLGILGRGRRSAVELTGTTAVRYAPAPESSAQWSWHPSRRQMGRQRIAQSRIRVHELSLYVGSGLRF